MAFVSVPVGNLSQPGTQNNPIIVAKGLSKRFGNQFAVQDVTFEVPEGVKFGFIGPSGSGKTTTIRLLTGVYKPTSGEVQVLGKRPARFSQRQRARLGYMPQHFVLYPYLTVWENMNFAASLYGMSLFRGKQLRRALEFVELYDARDKLASEISGGMQRRLSLAATLVHQPELIFLDEPTAGIDPVLRRKFWDHFEQLKEENKTLFITTQYVNEAGYCDLVGVMANGKLLMVDTPDGLRHKAFNGEIINLTTTQPIQLSTERELSSLPFVRGPVVKTSPNSMRITVQDAATAIPEILDWSRNHNLGIDAVEEYLPPFEDVFVELVKDEDKDG